MNKNESWNFCEEVPAYFISVSYIVLQATLLLRYNLNQTGCLTV